jgi:hypothetical protein
LAPWTEQVRAFRSEGFYDEFPPKASRTRLPASIRDLGRFAGNPGEVRTEIRPGEKTRRRAVRTRQEKTEQNGDQSACNDGFIDQAVSPAGRMTRSGPWEGAFLIGRRNLCYLLFPNKRRNQV